VISHFSKIVIVAALPLVALAQENTGLGDLSIEDLMNVGVVTASRTSEALVAAPATVIVVMHEEMVDRGYVELSEILDDLPGMEVVRPYGATYLKNYWRGYRNTIGDPFLVMVDGIVFNHLYFNTADVLTTIPLSNVDRVEVVYGPASVVYGANAFMGVINVITRRDAEEGTTLHGMVAGGSFDSRLIDLTATLGSEDYQVSLTGRIDSGLLDPSIADGAEYAGNRYYGDRGLWGGFIDNADLGGRFRSEREHRGFDLRLTAGTIEARLQYYRLTSGYGPEYPADRAQNNAVWSRPDLSAFVRDRREIRAGVNATTTLRYRESGVSNDSFFIENISPQGAPPVVDFSYWQSLNDSISFFEDVEVELRDGLRLNAGAKYERKDLQKAYETTYGPSLPPSEIDVASYPYPEPPGRNYLAQNRITTEDLGIYAELKWQPSEHHRLNLGVRVDDNSRYDAATTVRAGYVGSSGPWTFKALYGEAFQEPNNRLLYGGWDGSGSDPTLEPERSATTELSVAWTKGDVSLLGSTWYVENSDTFVSVEGGAENLGDRTVAGLDLHGRCRIEAGSVPVDFWGYYSHILTAREDTHDVVGSVTGRADIGDLARDKLWIGATARFAGRHSATVRARWVGDRDTVSTNPVKTIDSFLVVDAAMTLRRLFDTPLGVTVRVANLLDESYAHPGVRDASGGVSAGGFDDLGNWTGSESFYNSVLPQPGRSLTVVMRYEP